MILAAVPLLSIPAELSLVIGGSLGSLEVISMATELAPPSAVSAVADSAVAVASEVCSRTCTAVMAAPVPEL